MTDAVLFAATLYIALFSARNCLLRVSAALFSIAALLGALRFSGLYPEAAPHMFVSMIAGVAAFPAMAISVIFPRWRSTERLGDSLMIVGALAVLGALFVVVSGSRGYLNACALLAVVGIGFVSLRHRQWLSAMSATLILLGLLCFALKLSPIVALQPADILHLTLAAGWLGLNQFATPLSRG